MFLLVSGKAKQKMGVLTKQRGTPQKNDNNGGSPFKFVACEEGTRKKRDEPKYLEFGKGSLRSPRDIISCNPTPWPSLGTSSQVLL